jgi:hypothetical protein
MTSSLALSNLTPTLSKSIAVKLSNKYFYKQLVFGLKAQYMLAQGDVLKGQSLGEIVICQFAP